MSVITISRQAGSLGNEVAEMLSSKLGWELIDREKILSQFMAGIAKPYELRMLSDSTKYYLNRSGKGISYLQYMKEAITAYAEKESVVLTGFGSQAIFAENEQAVHIRVIAPESVRIQRIKKQYHVSDQEAKDILLISDRKHKRFVSTLFQIDVTDPSHYDLTLNTALLSIYECVAVILSLQREREQSQSFERESEAAHAISSTEELPVLKNPSETEFARILDMYHIDWRYEPKTFPIEWDAEGKITLAFRPDFYLTQFDTYIELTVMNQKYINKKMKKINRLRELYPGINIRIVNRKNFFSLLERFHPVKGEHE